MKIQIRDMITEVPESVIEDNELVDLEFGSDYQIQIGYNFHNATWRVTNAVNGWGQNCKEEFISEPVKIL